MLKKIKAALLKILTNIKTRPFDRNQIRQIIILRYDRIGDMIVSLPLCKALKTGIPSAEITMVASNVNSCISEESEFIDETIIKPNNILSWIHKLLILRSKRYDIGIDLNHAVAPHTVLALRLLHPKHVASPFKEGRWGVSGGELRMFDLMPAEHKLKYARPISETYLDIARLLNCPTVDCLPYPLKRYPRPSWPSSKYVVVNAAGSRGSMRIADKDLRIIAAYIIELDPNMRILVPAMFEDYDHFTNLFCDTPNLTVLTPTSSILPLLAIIQFAKLVITPDTALVHIACAFEIPLIAVYTSDEELFQQWQPLNGTSHSVVRSLEPKNLNGYSVSALLSLIDKTLGEQTQKIP